MFWNNITINDTYNITQRRIKGIIGDDNNNTRRVMHMGKFGKE